MSIFELISSNSVKTLTESTTKGKVVIQVSMEWKGKSSTVSIKTWFPLKIRQIKNRHRYLTKMVVALN